ncbi:hypothetical protein GCM10009127_05750 [Alteraurantiacibacter aestuarii]|uniref:Ferric reductase like transmembrane component n=1 Tax=Alteraurantiacibacter aestuarii TaxID=650004 RepID=A0A844ZND6_9SPHN|nr:hypothetical protein [Alteraurantiacibacter aestuarii]MXO89054.1 hypothetical protein [Alteraurantiacibacter aestuarii]
MASIAEDENPRRERQSDHESFLSHKRMRWMKIATFISLVAIVGYIFADVEPRPNGGTWYGYTLGTIGALLILWLTLLGVRKRRMSPGKWSLKAWTSAHVYLGLSLIVIATLHTGFQFGWNVHTLAYALMMVVILSGIYGISVYATLPASLSNNRREMTQAQMLEAVAAIDRQLEAAAQPLGREDADLVIAALEQDPFDFGLRARLSGNYRNCRTEGALAQLPENGVDPAEQKVLSLLRKRKAQLDQIRRHMRIKALLEIWLYVHVPVTIALLGALTAHIVSVFYYW